NRWPVKSSQVAPTRPRTDNRRVRDPSMLPVTSGPLLRRSSVGMDAPNEAPTPTIPGAGTGPRRSCAATGAAATAPNNPVTQRRCGIRILKLLHFVRRGVVQAGCRAAVDEAPRLTAKRYT